MSKPLIHCKSSVHKFGGVVEDYMEIHEFFDQTKSHIPDFRHRAILHNSFGIYLCQQVFGTHFKNSQGKDVSVRDVGEQHVIEDLGHIPTLPKCFENMPMDAWLSGRVRRRKTIRMEDIKSLNIIDEHPGTRDNVVD